MMTNILVGGVVGLTLLIALILIIAEYREDGSIDLWKDSK